MSASAGEHRNEMNEIMEEWNSSQNGDDYNPIPLLVR